MAGTARTSDLLWLLTVSTEALLAGEYKR